MTNPVTPNNPLDSKEIIRVSISEAARLFGVNPQTIRRAIHDQEITYVVVGGRYKVNFESLVKWSQRKTTVKHKSEKYGIGQYVDRWKISNTLYSPSKKTVPKKEPKKEIEMTPPPTVSIETNQSTVNTEPVT